MRKLLSLIVTILLARCDAPLVDESVPPRPDAGGVTRGTVETFAIDTVFLGDTDRGGAATNTAWKSFGYDLDGLVTDKDSTNVCTRTGGAPRTNQIDGNLGIDNATGEILLPILQSAASLPTPSSTTSQLIQQGQWTVQIQVDGFSGNDVVGVGAQVFTTGTYDQGTPAFDPTTDWPVVASSVRDGASIDSGALVQYEDAYVASDGTFVSGVPSDNPVVFPLMLPTKPNSPIAGALAVLTLRIHHAIITFRRSQDDPTRLVNGTIAGVLRTEEFIQSANECAVRMDGSFCGAAFDGFAQQIRQAQDILEDGTNASSIPCDAISIGIGFTARLVANPTKVIPDTPLSPDPCTKNVDAGIGDAALDATSDAGLD